MSGSNSHYAGPSFNDNYNHTYPNNSQSIHYDGMYPNYHQGPQNTDVCSIIRVFFHSLIQL